MGSRSVVGILVQIKQTGAAALGRVRSSFQTLRSAIFSVQTAVAGLAAFIAVHIGAKLVGAWAKQEQAVASLNAVLARTGRYSREATEALQKNAADIQKLTTVADEDLLKATAVLGKFATELSPAQLGQAQKTIVGLSAALGLDLNSAALTLGKSLSGEINLLGRFGISLDVTKGQADRFNEAFGKTVGFFEDAVAETQTLAGMFTQAQNAFGDFKETVGRVVVEIFGLNTQAGNLHDRIVQWDDGLKENIEAWIKWGRVVTALVNVVVKTTTGLIRLLFNSGQVIGDVFAVVVTSIITGLVGAANRGIELLNFLIRQANRIPGIAVSEIKKIPIAYFVEQTKGYAQDLADNAEDIRSTFTGVAHAWIAAKRAIEDNPIVNDRVVKAGAGAIDEVTDATEAAEKAIADATTRVALLNAQVEAGTISGAAWREGIDDIVVGLEAMAAAGAGSAENLTKVLNLLTQIRDRRKELTEPTPAPGGARPPGPDIGIPGIGPSPTEPGVPTPPSGPPPWLQPSAFERVRQELVAMGDAAGALDTVIADMTTRTLTGFADAITNAFRAMVDGSQSAGAAFASAMLGALAAVARGFGEFFLAQATASLASFFGPTPNPGGLAAAAKWAAAATAMFAISGVLSAVSAGVGGGGGGGGPEAPRAQGTEFEKESRGDVNVYIEGGLLNLNDPAQERAFMELLNDLSDRNVFVRTRRGGVFG